MKEQLLQDLFTKLLSGARNYRRAALWGDQSKPIRAAGRLGEHLEQLRDWAREYVRLALEHRPDTDWADWRRHAEKLRVVRDGEAVEYDPAETVLGLVADALRERGLEMPPAHGGVDWFAAALDGPHATPEELAAIHQRDCERFEAQMAAPPEWWRTADPGRLEAWARFREEQRVSVWNNRGRQCHPVSAG